MEGSVYTNVFLQPLMKTRCSACPWPNCGCHSSWWHTVNSLSPQSTFHSATINPHLTEKIYNCQEPSSLLKVFQGHRYHINRGWGGQEELSALLGKFPSALLPPHSPHLCSGFCYHHPSQSMAFSYPTVHFCGAQQTPMVILCDIPPLCLLSHRCN